MSVAAGFRKFVALDERDAPELLQRMTGRDLPVDGQRYGVYSRLIARDGTTISDLAAVALQKLCRATNIEPSELVALVLSSRIHDVQETAEAVAARLGISAAAVGVERACSGFPAATELAVQLCRQIQGRVAVVAAEIFSRSINWEPPVGDQDDHNRARGQASKLFADGAAAALVEMGGADRVHTILDAWVDEVADARQLIQKIDVHDSMDPWGSVRAGATTCMSMPGRRGWYLLRSAPELMAQALDRSLQNAAADRSLDGLSLTHVVHHQANGLMVPRLEKQLAAVPWGQQAKVWDCVRDMGNTVSATIPTAMAMLQDRLPAGAGGPGYRPDVMSCGCVLVRMGQPR